MSGDGKSKEGIAVVPLIQFVSIPANSLRALHKSAKRRVRLMAVDMAASMITTIMPADGVNTSPNVINIAGKRHRSWSEEVVDGEFTSLDQFTFYPGPILLWANSFPQLSPFLLMTVQSSIVSCYWLITKISTQLMIHHSLGRFSTAELILPMMIVLNSLTWVCCVRILVWESILV